MVEKRDYYVGEPTYKDPTSRIVFGNPSLKPVEDGGWVPRPVNRLSAEPEAVPTVYPRTFQITPDISSPKRMPTEAAKRLSEIQTQLTTMRACLGGKFRHSVEARDLKNEYHRLETIRRREKRTEREVF